MCSGLPSDRFAPGDTFIVETRWQGLLWSSIPHTFVEGSRDHVVSFVPDGTRWVCASNHGLPGTEALSRSERKLLALKTLNYWPREVPLTPTSLYFHKVGRWSRVSLGWSERCEFIGWYVNFELPPTTTPDGISSMDLVLDALIKPDGRWDWKDREDFDEAIAQGVLSADLRSTLEQERLRVLDDHANRAGAFAPHWQAFTPDPGWSEPILPERYRADGQAWRSKP